VGTAGLVVLLGTWGAVDADGQVSTSQERRLPGLTTWTFSVSGRMTPNTSDQGRFASRGDLPLVNSLGGGTTFYPSYLADGVLFWLGCAPTMLTPGNHRIRGLATVAMLKAQFDTGADHLEMFVPFVVDAIASMPTDDMTTAEVRERVYQRHSLVIPDHFLQTLLKRATKKGYARREAGRYHRVRHLLPDVNIQEDRELVEQQQLAVAQGLRQFAAEKNHPIERDEDALALILSFIAAYHVDVIVSEKILKTDVDIPSLNHKETILVADYIKNVVISSPELSRYIQTMLEGFVLQGTLLLKDIDDAKRRFDNLSVYFDTGIILRAVGLNGKSAQLSAKDTFATLRASGANLYVLEDTLEEVERVLSLYKARLGSSAGIRTLYPTETTIHAIAQGLTPSDIGVAMGTLRSDLTNLGVSARRRPDRVVRHTLDEADLARRLTRPGSTDVTEPRIKHDVDAVATIMVLRGGSAAHSLGNARAVFASNTGLVVKKVQEWFRHSGETGIPPVVHEVALANAAWLRQPADAATNMKLHQLMALCSAALQPSRKIWSSFVEQIRRVEESGKISSEESVLAVVLALTEERLIYADEESEIDADTVADVIARVKETYGAETEIVRRQLSMELTAAKSAQELLKEKFDLTATQAERRLNEERAKQLALEERIRAQSRSSAKWQAGIVFAIMFAVVFGGALLALPDVFPKEGLYRWLGWFFVVVAAILSFFDLVYGKHIGHWRDLLEEKLYSRRVTALLGDKEQDLNAPKG